MYWYPSRALVGVLVGLPVGLSVGNSLIVGTCDEVDLEGLLVGKASCASDGILDGGALEAVGDLQIGPVHWAGTLNP